MGGRGGYGIDLNQIRGVKMIPVIIFEFKGEKRELPLFLKSIDISGEFDQSAIIEIQAISSNESELEDWGRLTAYLNPKSGSKKNV